MAAAYNLAQEREYTFVAVAYTADIEDTEAMKKPAGNLFDPDKDYLGWRIEDIHLPPHLHSWSCKK